MGGILKSEENSFTTAFLSPEKHSYLGLQVNSVAVAL